MNAFWNSMLGALARTAIATGSGYAIARGTMTADDAQQTLGALAAAGVAAWSLFQKARAPAVIVAAVDAGKVPAPLLPAKMKRAKGPL